MRCEQLQSACELLADGLEEIRHQMQVYVRNVPLTCGETERKDAERFLDWLHTNNHRSDDWCCDARAGSVNAVEFVAIRRQLAWFRFQQIALSRRRPAKFHLQSTLYLNPIRIWSTVDVRCLEDASHEGPATVLFFALDRVIRAVALTSDAEELLKMLEHSGPIRFGALLRLCSHGTPDDVQDLVLSLIDLGVVACSA